MRLSAIFAAALAAPLAFAHGVPGAPKVFGLGSGVKSRDSAGPAARRAALPPKGHMFTRRQGGIDGQCGPTVGASCDPGYCCSSAGWCGNTEEYCRAPDCLIDYGPACDANKVPNGADTRNIPRPQLGSIPYGGAGIYTCDDPGAIAITFDDGPYLYTSGLLDLFASYNFKATFFITGNNLGKGAIDDAATPWPAIVQRMITDGHQVASHTWSHQNLSAITQAQRINQMVRNEMAIRNIIQKFPTYMRPPYSACSTQCQADLAALGYVITYFDLDTDDYNNPTPDKIQAAKDNFKNKVNPSNPAVDDFLEIGHDIIQQTSQNLTAYMLDLMVSKGYRGVTVGECLGDPPANWYRASSGTVVTSVSSLPSSTQASSSAAPTASPTAVSVDGTCGGTTGYTCIGFASGSCCSQYGWCGATTDHCGTGCQIVFGTCGNSVSSSAAPASSSAVSSSAASSSAASSSAASSSAASSSAASSSAASSSVASSSAVSSSAVSSSAISSAVSSSSRASSSSLVVPSSSSRVSSSSRSSSTSVRPSSTTSSSAKASATPKVSTNGRCGPLNQGMTCNGYKGLLGISAQCCSVAGVCGADLVACGIGCQKSYSVGCLF